MVLPHDLLLLQLFGQIPESDVMSSSDPATAAAAPVVMVVDVMVIEADATQITVGSVQKIFPVEA